MTNRPTPQTDAAAFGILEDRPEGRYRRIVVDVELCETLEQKLDAAMETIELLEERIADLESQNEIR